MIEGLVFGFLVLGGFCIEDIFDLTCCIAFIFYFIFVFFEK